MAERPPRPTAARRSPTRAPRAARRSAALALAAGCLAAAAAAGAAGAAIPSARFTGQATDALRTPTHRLAASPDTGRAVADLVFADAQHAQTTVRTCVRRRAVAAVRTCFAVTTGAAGVATVTPLRFPVGSYIARWWVDGVVVAKWRFAVV
jgi:hypothetical protein